MKGWRSIIHNGERYWWRVATSYVVVRQWRGPVIVRKCLSEVMGMSFADIERAKWKGNPLPAITPSDIVEYLKETERGTHDRL